VRERFAAACADAQHAFVMAATAPAARQAGADAARPVHLALVDLGLADAGDGIALVHVLARMPEGRPRPVVVFAGSVQSAADIQALNAARIAGYVNEFATTAQILPALAPHLFPDSFNRRASARVPLEMPIVLRSGDAVAGAMTVNVGRGGVAIRTMQPIAASSIVSMTFRLPGTAEEVAVDGRVAWTDRTLMVGVQFDALPDAAERAIRALQT
jgi:CheY-like chemotaxis protein